jgi:glyoxylase I family protein
MINDIIAYSSRVKRGLHHVAFKPRDFDRALRFYRDGIGLDVFSDETFEGPFGILTGAPSDRLRSVFLGDAASPHRAAVELVVCLDERGDPIPVVPAAPSNAWWIAFWVDVDATIDRLVAMQMADSLVVTEPGYGAKVASVRDPDGVLVELVSQSIVTTMPG